MKHPVKHLPLWDVMGNTLVTTDGALWRAFELLPRDSLQMTEAALETLSKTIYTLGSAELQPNLALQIQADIHKERQSHLSAYHNIQSGNALLNRQRIMRHRHLKSSPNREIRLTLMVGWRPQSNKEFPKLSRATHQAREEHLREAIQSLRPIFHNGGVILKPLDPQSLERLLLRTINIQPPLREQQPNPRLTQVLKSQSPREAFLREPIQIDSDWLKVGPHFVSVSSMTHLPEMTCFGFSDIYRMLPAPSRVVFHLKTPKQNRTKEILQQSRRFAFSQAFSTHRNIHNENQKLSYQTYTEVERELAETQQKLVHVGLQIITHASTSKALEQQTLAIQETLRRVQINVMAETNNHHLEFFKSIPGCNQRFDRWHLTTSNVACDLMPLSMPPSGDREPLLLLETTHQELIQFDPMEESRDNWNTMILGASGSGKSVFVNSLIMAGMLTGKSTGRIMVVDYAGYEKSSYRMLGELFGAQFSALLDAGNPTCLNPFPPKQDAIQDSKLKPSVESKLSIATNLLLGIERQNPNYQRLSDIVLRALVRCYAHHNHPTYNILKETLTELEHDELIDTGLLLEVRQRLEGFLSSSHAKRFVGQTTLSLDHPFVILDLFGIETLPPQIQAAYAFLTIGLVKEVAFQNTDDLPTYILLDEVAQLLRVECGIQALIEELFSTARKHQTAVYAITQNWNSFAKADLAQTLSLNSTTKILLSHGDDDLTRRQIITDLDLNSREQELFRELQTRKGKYSEFLFKSRFPSPRGLEETALKCRLKLTPYEYEITTSDAKDRQKQQAWFEKNPTIPKEDILYHLAYGEQS